MDLTLSTTFNFQKGLYVPAQAMILAPAYSGNTTGSKAIENFINVGAADVTLDLGSLSSIGAFMLLNLASVANPPFVDPVITQGGAAGTTTDTYALIFNYPDGSLSVSDLITTNLANATLNVTNFNILTWTNPAGVSSVNVYRTSAGGTPSTLGKIGTAVSSPFNDAGLAGDGTTLPVAIASKFPLVYGAVSGTYPLLLEAGRWGQGQWNAAAMHFKATGPIVTTTNLQYVLVEP